MSQPATYNPFVDDSISRRHVVIPREHVASSDGRLLACCRAREGCHLHDYHMYRLGS